MSVLGLPNRLTIKNGKHLTVSKKTVSADYPWHWHSFFEIEIILSGAGKCIINDVAYDFEEKNLYLLSSTDFHHTKPDGVTEIINISFDESMLDQKYLGELLHAQRDRAYRFDEEEYERLLLTVELLKSECEIDGECQSNLLQYLLTCILRKNQGKTGHSATDNHYLGIRNSIAYMEIHFRENVTLKRLAAESGYHPGYFSELYKRIVGEGYVDTLNKLRVSYAKTLLSNGFSVSDACFLSGFGSLSNFLTTFKRYCQMTPRDYKRLSLSAE